MRLEFFDFSHLHDSRADISQTIGRQTRASDVFHVRRQIDARVLLGVTVGSFFPANRKREMGGQGQLMPAAKKMETEAGREKKRRDEGR